MPSPASATIRARRTCFCGVLPLAINASSLSRSPSPSWILTFLPMPADSHQIRLLGIICCERNTRVRADFQALRRDCERYGGLEGRGGASAFGAHRPCIGTAGPGARRGSRFLRRRCLRLASRDRKSGSHHPGQPHSLGPAQGHRPQYRHSEREYGTLHRRPAGQQRPALGCARHGQVEPGQGPARRRQRPATTTL